MNAHDTVSAPIPHANHTSALTAALVVALLGFARTATAQEAYATSTLTRRTPTVYVSNSGSHTVSVLDAASGALRTTIPVGLNPAQLALRADGQRAFVPNTGSDTLSIVSTVTNTVLATVPVGDAPAIAAVTPDGGRVYVGCANGIVSVVDVNTNATVTTITLGAPAQGYSVAGLALSPDGTRALALWGDLHVIDTTTNTIVQSVYAGNNPTGLALSPDGARAYVSAAFGYGPFSFYGAVTAVDTSTWSVTNVIGTWSMPTSITVSPDGTRAFVSTPSNFVDTGYGAGYLSSPWIARLDLTTNTLAGGVNVGGPARNLAFLPNGNELFVAVPNQGVVKRVNALTNTITATVPVGASPVGVAVRR